MRQFSKARQGVVLLALTVLVSGCGPVSGSKPRLIAPREADITVLSYNVQNLFDGVSHGSEYRDFDPKRSDYNESHYRGRLDDFADFVSQQVSEPPTVLALQEIENRRVLLDLLEALGWSYAYPHVIFDPARVGSVGVALASALPVTQLFSHRPVFHGRPARTILEVHLQAPGQAALTVGSGAAGNRTAGSHPQGPAGPEPRSRIVVFVNHWKSQRPTPEETEPQRRLAATIVARRLAATSAGLSLVVGDLNTDRPGLTALTQPWERIDAPGSYAYQGRWQRLDHILFASDGTYELLEFAVMQSPEAVTREGYPRRWIPGLGGLSDHLPLFARFSQTPASTKAPDACSPQPRFAAGLAGLGWRTRTTRGFGAPGEAASTTALSRSSAKRPMPITVSGERMSITLPRELSQK